MRNVARKNTRPWTFRSPALQPCGSHVSFSPNIPPPAFSPFNFLFFSVCSSFGSFIPLSFSSPPVHTHFSFTVILLSFFPFLFAPLLFSSLSASTFFPHMLSFMLSWFSLRVQVWLRADDVWIHRSVTVCAGSRHHHGGRPPLGSSELTYPWISFVGDWWTSRSVQKNRGLHARLSW